MSLIRLGTTIPVFVKRLREEMSLSQNQFGEMLGYHGQYVSNIERGVHKVPIAFTEALLTVVSGDREKYLRDLLADAAANKIYARLKKRKRVIRP